MTVAEQTRRSGFSLRLEQGQGRLVLAQRRIADLFTVEQLQLTLHEVPARLDLTRGVERFRHAHGRVEQLTVAAEDHDVTRALALAMRDAPLADLEVRAVDGDLVVAGEVRGEPPAPFVARARVETAGIGDERSLLVSFFEVRVLGVARLCAPQVAAALLAGFGLDGFAVGPTAARFDPIDGLLLEAFAEIGWKLPDRRGLRLTHVRLDGGRLRLTAERPAGERPALRAVTPQAGPDGGVRYRRFLADYEAKTLYADTEALIADGRLDRAIAAYERQIEVHPDHPFLIARLLQLLVARPESRSEAAALASTYLQRYPDDLDALTALAVARQAEGRAREAAEAYERLGAVAEARGDVLEAAQARCAVAAALAEAEPRAAIVALEKALGLRRRLPAALRFLAELHARTGDWPAALRARERLLSAEAEPARRRALLHELGTLALDAAGDVEAAAAYYERALELDADDVEALLGLAAAQERAGRTLPAVRALDRAADLLQQRGDAAGAAAAMVRLGDLWRRLPEGAQSAALRYRRALMLDPRRAGALLGLAETAVEQGSAHQARAHLEELLRLPQNALLEPVDRADVHLRLGRLLAQSLEDRPLAVAHYQKVLEGRPEQAAAALAELEGLYASEARWDDLARVLRVAADRASDAAERGARLVRLALVARDHLGDAGHARKLLEEAAALRPSDPAVLEALADLHRARRDHAALADVLAELAERVDAPSRLAAAYTERADLLRTHLNRADEAMQVYTLALGCVPTWREALDGLADLYRERERFGELAPLLGRRAEIERDPRAAANLWLELARLQTGPLHRARDAARSLEHAVRLVPDDAEALRRLGDVHFDAGRLDAAAEIYRRLHALYARDGYDEPAVPFLLRLAEVLAGTDAADDALGILAEAADLAPDDTAIFEQIQDLLLRRGDVEAIVAAFRSGLAQARAADARAFLARRAGRLLWRELRRPGDAAALLDEALRLRPEDDDLRRVRLEVATALGDWPRVAGLLRAQLERAPAPERPSLLTRLAELAFGALERPEEGWQLAYAALDEDPRYLPALTLVAERAHEAGDWARASDAWRRVVAIEGDHASPEDVLRLASAELNAGDAAAALPRLRGLHAAGLRLAGQGAALAEAALRLGDAVALETVLDERLAALRAEAAAVRERFLRRAAGLFGAAPEHRERAVALWTTLVEELPGDSEATQALATLKPSEAPAAVAEADACVPPVAASEPTAALESAPPPDADAVRALDTPLDAAPTDVDFTAFDAPPATARAAGLPVESDDVAAALERLEADVAGAADDAACAAAWLALGEFRRDALHDPDEAVPALREALRLAEPGGEVWGEAREALEDVFAVRGDWEALLELYDERLARGLEPAGALFALKASILRAAERFDEAIEAAEAAVAAGDERARELLVDLLMAEERASEAADRLTEDADALAPADAARRRRTAAELVADEDPARALGLYRQAAAVLKDAVLCEEWLALARRAGAPVDRLDALVARAQLFRTNGPEGMRRGRLLQEAGAVADSEIGDSPRARALFEASIAAWPDNVEVLEALTAVLERLGDAEALEGALSRQIELALPGAWRGRLALRLAALRHEVLGRDAEAVSAARMAAEDLGGTPDAEDAALLLALLGATDEDPDAG